MAIIVPSLGVIKGKLGGVVFQENPAGNVLRTRPFLKKTSTARQASAHASQQGLIHEWGALTLEQQISWNEYAALWPKVDRFGISRVLNGWNWFNSVNSQLLFCGGSLLASPPAHTSPAEPPGFNLLLGESALEIELTGEFNFEDNYLLAFATAPTSRSSLSANRIRRRLGRVTDPGEDNFDITEMWENAIGISYAPVTSFPGARIILCLQSVAKVSGISSPYLCAFGSTAAAESSSFYYYL